MGKACTSTVKAFVLNGDAERSLPSHEPASVDLPLDPACSRRYSLDPRRIDLPADEQQAPHQQHDGEGNQKIKGGEE